MESSFDKIGTALGFLLFLIVGILIGNIIGEGKCEIPQVNCLAEKEIIYIYNNETIEEENKTINYYKEMRKIITNKDCPSEKEFLEINEDWATKRLEIGNYDHYYELFEEVLNSCENEILPK